MKTLDKGLQGRRIILVAIIATALHQALKDLDGGRRIKMRRPWSR